MATKPSERSEHERFLVGLAVIAAWTVVVCVPFLEHGYLILMAIVLLALPVAGLVALVLTVWDFLMRRP